MAGVSVYAAIATVLFERKFGRVMVASLVPEVELDVVATPVGVLLRIEDLTGFLAYPRGMTIGTNKLLRNKQTVAEQTNCRYM